jgi:hypothetical protein
VLLARFHALDTQNKELLARVKELEITSEASSSACDKELLAENTELRAQLGFAAKQKQANGAQIPEGQCLDAGSMGSKGQTLEKFCQELASMGVNVDGIENRQALEELYTSVRQGEIQISRVGSNQVMQQYKVVRVYILANIAGDEKCLIEHDRFNLKSGSQDTLMVPLEVRIQQGESWYEASKRGLQNLVGLNDEWQEHNVDFDQSSYYCHQEQRADENCFNFLTSLEVHEIHGRIRMEEVIHRKSSRQSVNHSVDDLDRIGLPGGRDFVYCDRVSTVVHVWCWKSREYEKNGRIKSFEKYLQAHGVNIAEFGCGTNKTLFQFYNEAKELKHCSLHEVVDDASSGPKLQRVVQILKIKLIAEVHKRKRMLMESEQWDADGRKKPGGQLIVKKLCDGEDWRDIVPLAIHERIGVHPNLQTECFQLDDDKTQYTEEVVKSKGFAGIMTCYKIRTVTSYVIDPTVEALEMIGLPRGNDFVSRSECRGLAQGGMNLHVWTWAPAVDEDGPGGNQFNGTALELLNRDLSDVESLLANTACDPQVTAIGCDGPIKQAVQKLKSCAERLCDIDKTIATVDMSDVMGQDTSSPRRNSEGASAMSGLKSFIEANFVRQVATVSKISGDKSPGDGLRDDDNGSNMTRVATVDTFQQNPQLSQIIEGRETWDFDFFALYDELGPNMLEKYAEAIVAPRCVNILKCNTDCARKFASDAAGMYFENPYHGPIHAAQVTHLSRWLTKAMRIQPKQSDYEEVAFTIAGLCHDIRHPGRNNAFCVVTEDPLALLYSNNRVLESFHSATCIQLMEATELLTNMSQPERAGIRSHIIDNILATDMAEHFETISKFRVRRDAQDFSTDVETDRKFVARLCLKAGDLGHACLPWDLHVEWALRITCEFYAQGDEEAKRGLPVSALCDRRDLNGLAKSQKGFLDFVVLPLFTALSDSQTGKQDEEPKKVEDTGKGATIKRRRSSAMATGLPYHIETTNIASLHANGVKWTTDEESVQAVQARIAATAPDAPEEQSASES